MEFCYPLPMEYFLRRILRILSLFLKLWDKKIWNITSFLKLVKYYTTKKFYETIPVINTKKGHQK